MSKEWWQESPQEFAGGFTETTGTHHSSGSLHKPALTIDLIAPESDVYFLVEEARITLEQAGQVDQSKALGDWFYSLPLAGSDVIYDEVRKKIEEYCDVTWLNEEAVS